MSVDTRLEKLERENRSCRRIVVGLVLLFGATMTSMSCNQTGVGSDNKATQNDAANKQGVAAPTPRELKVDSLRIRELVLVNKNGKEVGLISAGDGPGEKRKTIIKLTSPNGASTTVMMASNQSAEFQAIKKGSLTAAVTSEGIGVKNKNGELVSQIGSSKKGNGGFLAVFNQFGKPVIGAFVNNKNSGQLYINDADEKTIWRRP